MPDNPNDLEDRIKYLVKEIERHRYLYYNKQPEISDAKYDSLEDELRDIDPKNPILFKIGVDYSELFTKREHIIPMTSQDKVSNPQDFIAWVRKRNIKTFLVQFKLDGISIELQYEDGDFKHAVTRGDGKIGDDVSINVIKMKGFIPKLINRFTGAVRAEILLFHDIFDKKYADKQNCRNAAAGIVRRKDGVGCNDLNLIFYDAISITVDVVFTSEVKKLKWLKDQNFPTIKTKTIHTPQEVIKVRKDVIDNIRSSLEYDIDGLVIKGNEIDIEDMQRTKPMKQVAFKFQAEEIETKLLDVEWSISGQNYTPVAIVETVKLAGSNVSRASLANPNLIEELGIKIGSEVVISKRGDIIPKIERVVKNSSETREIIVPKICEVCDTELVNEGTRIFCPNEACPKRVYYRLVRWIKKLNVKHFSEKLMLKPLFKSRKVRKIADLYKLKIRDLTLFEGVKETSAKKALDNLLAVKEVSLAKFIGGFAIENVGEDLAQRIVDAGYNTLDKIRNSSVLQLSQVEGFARKTAQQLLEGVLKIYPLMKELLDTNKIKIQETSQSKKFNGLSFCFTGKLNTIKRTRAEQLVKDLGGQPKSSVVSNLTYLVTNSTDQSAKYLKAQNQVGTKIITEEEFIKLIKS